MMRSAGRHGQQSGAIVAGTWLIGLGLIFIIHDQAGWSWGQAWPLFVILAGVGSLVSALVGWRHLPVGAWSLVWPLAWIGVGVVLLMSATGAIAIAPGELVGRWWPVALIAIGVWFLIAAIWPRRRGALETLSLPLQGATSADMRIRFGGGDLTVERGAPGMLVSGTFAGGVIYRMRAPGSVELEPDTSSGWWSGRGYSWRVGLTGEVPLDLRLDSGASRSTLDLSQLLVRRIDLRTGASETRVRLPQAGGATLMKAQTGAASLTVEVPPRVAARISARMALGSVSVDEVRFPPTASGYASPDYDTAPNRVDIDIEGGVGSVRIA